MIGSNGVAVAVGDGVAAGIPLELGEGVAAGSTVIVGVGLGVVVAISITAKAGVGVGEAVSGAICLGVTLEAGVGLDVGVGVLLGVATRSESGGAHPNTNRIARTNHMPRVLMALTQAGLQPRIANISSLPLTTCVRQHLAGSSHAISCGNLEVLFGQKLLQDREEEEEGVLGSAGLSHETDTPYLALKMPKPSAYLDVVLAEEPGSDSPFIDAVGTRTVMSWQVENSSGTKSFSPRASSPARMASPLRRCRAYRCSSPSSSINRRASRRAYIMDIGAV